ncbi:acyl-CoA dehydratase activase [Konateibacter massiliensis]|uniref:acyl-CoA dehydratase activase n=1 Tax=Konateibacter massiliensis TaxID=2002841 RepID=UPI000C15424D|nr:acyl-CoA dehydratase activase [Konateibacter massiliensis]
MSYTIGIDIGSTTSKCILLDSQRIIVAKALVQAGTGTDGPARAYGKVLKEAGLKREDIAYIMSTGYGRASFEEADANMSELSCHAKGVYRTMPDIRTIIDIGGQDAKVIRLNDKGSISNFVMNDKCAAGTGRFLEVMANILQLEVKELESYALRAKEPVKISSTCTVFAESEVISQLSKNVDVSDLIAGICGSVASRVAGLAKRIGIQNQVCMSGGVAKNGGVRGSLERELGTEIFYSEDAQYMGAYGAAIFASEKV